MIKRFDIRGFKGILHSNVALGPGNIAVGPTGTGKTSLIEALAVYSRLAAGEPTGAVLKPRSAAHPDGIRGGLHQCSFRSKTGVNTPDHSVFTAEGQIVEYTRSGYPVEGSPWTLAFTVTPGTRAVTLEWLKRGDDIVYECATRRSGIHDTALLSQLAAGEVPQGYQGKRNAKSPTGADIQLAQAIETWHRRVRRLDLNPRILAKGSESSNSGNQLDSQGEDLGPRTARILADHTGRAVFASWLSILCPDSGDPVTVQDDDGTIRFGLHRRGTLRSGEMLSDGQLRTAGLLAAHMEDPGPSMLLIDGIDTVLAGSEDKPLIDTLHGPACGTQIVATAHRPTLAEAARANRPTKLLVTETNPQAGACAITNSG